MFVQAKSKVGAKSEVNLHKIDKPNLPIDKRKKTEEYMMCLKPSADYDYLTIAGVCFSKKSYSPERNVVHNDPRDFPDRYLTAQMTEDQVAYIKERAKKIKREVVDSNGVRKTVCFLDMLMLEKVSDFMRVDEKSIFESKVAKYDSN